MSVVILTNAFLLINVLITHVQSFGTFETLEYVKLIKVSMFMFIFRLQYRSNNVFSTFKTL